MQLKARRFLGLELGGSRSHRTALVALDYFESEHRAFVAELHAQLHGGVDETADAELARLISSSPHEALGVNAPLSLPPCVACTLPVCPTFERCDQPAILWMREEAKKVAGKARPISPYTQRPVDLLHRGRWQDEAPFDESFGSGRAPLAARMLYLKRQLASTHLLEVNPRLALAGLAPWFAITKRELRRCRDVEEGLENRASILEKLSGAPRADGVPRIFLYNADLAGFAKDLSAFDALIVALMALYGALNLLETEDWDPAWGRVARPKRLAETGARLPSWEAEK